MYIIKCAQKQKWKKEWDKDEINPVLRRVLLINGTKSVFFLHPQWVCQHAPWDVRTPLQRSPLWSVQTLTSCFAVIVFEAWRAWQKLEGNWLLWSDRSFIRALGDCQLLAHTEFLAISRRKTSEVFADIVLAESHRIALPISAPLSRVLSWKWEFSQNGRFFIQHTVGSFCLA